MTLRKVSAFLLLASQVVLSGFASGRNSASGVCMTSQQKQAYIVIDVNKEGEQTKATITTADFDGTNLVVEEVEGREPEVGITFATTSKGENIFILNYIDGSENFIQYVCSETE